MSAPAGPRLLGPAQVRSLAADLDLRPTKQRGQNFVIDPNTVRRIVRESGVGRADVVVEVGPGLGSLTLGLLEAVDRVVAIEVDERLAALLPETVATYAPDHVDRLDVVAADALRVTALPGPAPTALVANLPYNVSVPVLLHLLALLPSLERGLVMVQSEVADRLAAGPGSKVYGIPSVKAAWFADVRRAGAIGRHVFWPAPNVDSGLVAWTRRDPPATTATRETVFAVVDAAFAHRRKTLRAALRAKAGSTEASQAVLLAAGVDPEARGEVLDIGAFVRIAEALDAVAPRMTHDAHVTVRVPAKVNLHLGVGAPRPDGFHPLDTVYQAVGLYDDVTARAADGWSVDVRPAGHVAADALPAAGDNIVGRAARLLAGLHGVEPRGKVVVDKDIPIAGGMAGGSADAAGALVALDRLWGLDTSDDDLLRLAAELGSDVPFALVGGSAHGTGRGEVVHSVADEGAWWWVVVPAREGLSTPAVYRRFDQLNPDAPAEPTGPLAVLSALHDGDVVALGRSLHNDLQPAALALRPDLEELIAAGEDAGALRGLVSGSGPTVVFLAGSADQARAVAGGLAAAYDVVLVVPGPVAGAHIVWRA